MWDSKHCTQLVITVNSHLADTLLLQMLTNYMIKFRSLVEVIEVWLEMSSAITDSPYYGIADTFNRVATHQKLKNSLTFGPWLLDNFHWPKISELNDKNHWSKLLFLQTSLKSTIFHDTFLKENIIPWLFTDFYKLLPTFATTYFRYYGHKIMHRARPL